MNSKSELAFVLSAASQVTLLSPTNNLIVVPLVSVSISNVAIIGPQFLSVHFFEEMREPSSSLAVPTQASVFSKAISGKGYVARECFPRKHHISFGIVGMISAFWTEKKKIGYHQRWPLLFSMLWPWPL